MRLLSDQKLLDALGTPSTDQTIQTHGALIAADPKFDRITHFSTNIRVILGVDGHEMIGQSVEKHLSLELCHDVRNALGYSSIDRVKTPIGPHRIADRRVQILAHRVSTATILEIWPATEHPDLRSSADLAAAHRAVLAPIPQEMLDHAAQLIRARFGFDRVEARPVRAGSTNAVYSDQLSLLIMRDLDAPTSHVIAAPDADPQLDLARAMLRAGPEPYRRALRDCGIIAHLVLPVCVRGALWALISCAHPSHLTIAPDDIVFVEFISRALGDAIGARATI